MNKLTLLMVVSCVSGTMAEPRKPLLQPDDEAKFYNASSGVTYEINQNPIPFCDWALVEAGTVGWMGEEGDVIALSGEHKYERPEQVIPVPVRMPSGIRIVAQPAAKGPRFEEWFKATLPWERGMEPRQVHFDELSGLYRMWYRASGSAAYAESRDLKTWAKPLTNPTPRDGQPGSNLLYLTNGAELKDGIIKNPEEINLDQLNGMVFDPHAPAEERLKGTIVLSSNRKRLEEFAQRVGKPISPMVSEGSANCVYGAVSADGIAWQILPEPILLHDADTFTVTRWDERRRKYVMYTRWFESGRRTIARSESADFRSFPLPDSVVAPTAAEAPTIDYYSSAFSPYPGQPELSCIFNMQYQRLLDTTEVYLWTSRNGILWEQTPGGPVLGRGERGNWDASYVHIIPSLLRTPEGRMMVFYSANRMPHKFPRTKLQGGGNGTASWQADRLAALEAPERGEFTTTRVRLRGGSILLNFQTEYAGEVRAELLDERLRAVPGFTLAGSEPLHGDELAAPLSWKGSADLRQFDGKLIFLRFHLRSARLFALRAGDTVTTDTSAAASKDEPVGRQPGGGPAGP